MERLSQMRNPSHCAGPTKQYCTSLCLTRTAHVFLPPPPTFPHCVFFRTSLANFRPHASLPHCARAPPPTAPSSPPTTTATPPPPALLMATFYWPKKKKKAILTVLRCYVCVCETMHFLWSSCMSGSVCGCVHRLLLSHNFRIGP